MNAIALAAFAWLMMSVNLGVIIYRYRKYPSADRLKPDAAGLIHHPTYGVYPAEVPYKAGMNLYPGQSATMIAVVEGKRD